MSNLSGDQHATTDKWLIGAAIIMAVMMCLIASCFVVFYYFNPPNLFADPESTQGQPVIYTNPGLEITTTPFQPLPTATLTPTPTPTPTPIPTPTSMPTPTPIPSGKLISGVYGNPQMYSLDCEARSAVDWATFFGFHISESDFLNRMPKSDDPENGFVGNVNGYLGQFPPKSYGVHARPVAAVLREYGVNAQSFKGFTWADLKKEILAGRPVITWIVNYPYDIEIRAYTATSNGNTTTVARYEHTWIISGYDSWSVTVVDSQWTYRRNINEFLTRWSALGNMVVVLR
jgi:uncharacterized protein YvpB